MTSSGARALRPWIAAGVCAVAGAAVFQWYGNSTRGYIDTASLFWWWASQWFNPAAETQHGPLILAIAAGLLWWKLRRLRTADCGMRIGGRDTRGASNPDQRPLGPSEALEPSAQSAAPPSQPPTASTRFIPLNPQSALRNPESDIPSNPQSAISNPQSPAPHPVAPQSSTSAIAAMMAGLALHALGYLVQQTRISIAGLLLFTWGGLRLGGGVRWGRAALFPVAFLVFAVPVSFLETLGFHLRLAVIATTEALAHLAGIDVVRNGTQLFAPDGRYQYDVAAACSGVRSLMALLALSLLIGYVNLQSPTRRLAVFALAFPLTFLGNVIRIAGVVFAGEWFGQRAGEWVHDWAGFIVFAIVLGGVQLAANRLSRRETAQATCHFPSDMLQPPPEVECHALRDKLPTSTAGKRHSMRDLPLEAPRDECHSLRDIPVRRAAGECHVASDMFEAGDAGLPVRRVPVWGTLGVVGFAMVVAVFTTRVDAWLIPAGAGVTLDAKGEPAQLPAFIATEWIGRAAEVTPVEREVLPADTGYARRTYTSTYDRREQVFLSIVLSGRDRTSIHRPELCLVGQGWTVEDRMEKEFSHPSGGKVPAAVLRLSREVVTPNGERLRVPALFAYWFVGRDALATTTAERMWHTAINRLRLQPDRWAYVVAQTPVLPSEEETAALARIQEVLSGTLPAFQPVAQVER